MQLASEAVGCTRDRSDSPRLFAAAHPTRRRTPTRRQMKMLHRSVMRECGLVWSYEWMQWLWWSNRSIIFDSIQSSSHASFPTSASATTAPLRLPTPLEVLTQYANHLGPKSEQRLFDSADFWGVFNSLRQILLNKCPQIFFVCHNN